jgi:hypothetical protein
MRTREEIEKFYLGKGPINEVMTPLGILEVLLDIRDLLTSPAARQNQASLQEKGDTDV